MKFVINECYGGFNLNNEWFEKNKESFPTGKAFTDFAVRTNKTLISAIESGEYKDKGFSQLKVVEIPEGKVFTISEYDGYESICFEEDFSWFESDKKFND